MKRCSPCRSPDVKAGVLNWQRIGPPVIDGLMQGEGKFFGVVEVELEHGGSIASQATGTVRTILGFLIGMRELLHAL